MLDAELGWWHDGERLSHPKIIEAFTRGVRLDDDGRYRLEFGGEDCFITVQGCAFGVTAVDSDVTGWKVSLTDGTQETLAPQSLEQSPDGALTVAVKHGAIRNGTR